MNIWITNIKIQSISSIGSFNVGKTVLCRNESVSNVLTGEAKVKDTQSTTDEITSNQPQTPIQSQLSISPGSPETGPVNVPRV